MNIENLTILLSATWLFCTPGISGRFIRPEGYYDNCVTVKIVNKGWYTLTAKTLNGNKPTCDENTEDSHSARCCPTCRSTCTYGGPFEVQSGMETLFEKGREVIYKAKAGRQKKLKMEGNGEVKCKGTTLAGFECEFKLTDDKDKHKDENKDKH